MLEILSDDDDRMGAKIKTHKKPYGFQQILKKISRQKITPKKNHAEFLTLNFPERGNNITQRKT